MNMHPKDFYRNYQADNLYDALDAELIREVLSFSPNSIFEFGCGSGKNLMLAKDFNSEIETVGLDISIINVIQSHLNGVDSVIRGDERHMPCRKFDVCFTCSVLDHIEDIDQIIDNLKSISTKAILLAETNSFDTDFYYSHDYEGYGFIKTDFVFVSKSDRATYYIWKYIIPQIETETECAG